MCNQKQWEGEGALEVGWRKRAKFPLIRVVSFRNLLKYSSKIGLKQMTLKIQPTKLHDCINLNSCKDFKGK